MYHGKALGSIPQNTVKLGVMENTVVPTLRRERQEHLKFKVIFYYLPNSDLA